MSGSYTTDGEHMAELVKQSGYEWDDFFIFSATGTDDFAYSAFKAQIMAIGNVTDGAFRFAENEGQGILPFWNGKAILIMALPAMNTPTTDFAFSGTLRNSTGN